MNLLIDTSTKFSGISIFNDNFFDHIALDKKNASENIISNIDDLLKRNNISLKKLNTVICIIGPASFTGVRIAVAVANQFVHQLKISSVSLKTYEFYELFVDKRPCLYIQSLNKDEIYIKALNSKPLEKEIILVSDFINDFKDISYCGELSLAHKELLKDFNELNNILNLEDALLRFAKNLSTQKYSEYKLFEAFYAKKPNISVSKKVL